MTSRVATATLLLTLFIQHKEGFKREVRENDQDDSFIDNLDGTSMRSTYDKIFQVFSYFQQFMLYAWHCSFHTINLFI